jgi:hypothetical protein
MSTARRQTRLARPHAGHAAASRTPLGLALWRHFEAGEWDEAQALLDPSFVARWPQSDEWFQAPGYIALNRAHPAPDWTLLVYQVVDAPGACALQVTLEHAEGTDHGACFYVIARGRILEATELWAERTPAPAWRATWSTDTAA